MKAPNKIVELGSVAEIVMGLSPPGSTYNRAGIGSPLLNGPTEFGTASPEPDVFTTDPKRTAQSGDILFCVRGSTTGRMNWADQEYAIGRGIAAIRARDCSDTHYLRGCIENHLPGLLQKAGGSTFPNLSFRDLATLEIPFPPLPVQRKISALLSAYDDLIENNNRRIKLLEEMAQRIYREWFVGFRYPGHGAVPLVDSELGQIPERWTACPLSELVSTQYGYTESATSEPSGPRFLRGMDINKTSYIDWSTVPFCPIAASDLDRYCLVRGDILVIRMADPGKVGIVEQDVNAVFASYLIRVRPVDTRIDPCVLFYFMSSDRYQSFASGASTGTTRKSLSAPLITSISIALPPSELQVLFVSRVAPLRDLITGLVRSNTTLRNSRDLLLPRLISGEIDVADLDIALAENAA